MTKNIKELATKFIKNNKKVTLHLVIKSYENDLEELHQNIASVDDYLDLNYTRYSLNKAL